MRKRPDSLSGTPIWIVITGNVRSGREFEGIFNQAFELRRQSLVDGILWATWQSELEQFPTLEKNLGERGVEIVAIDPPDPQPAIHPLFHGYVFHQRKALQFALRALPAKCFVLKSRTDFAEERFTALTHTLFECPPIGLDIRIKEPLLQKRLFTFDARTDYFFYWDDIVFSGMREDLLALNNCDVSPEVIYPAHFFAAEMRLFAPYFLRHYAVLAWFFENLHGEKFGQVLAEWARSGDTPPLPDLLMEILAAYFHVVSRYLTLPPSTETNEEPIRLKQLFSESPSWGIRNFPTPWPSHKLVSSALLEAFQNLPKNAEEGLQKLAARMRELDELPAERLKLPADLEAKRNELLEFGRRFGVELDARSARYLPAPTLMEEGDLTNLQLPEKRFLSRWEQKKLGARRVLARWCLKRVL